MILETEQSITRSKERSRNGESGVEGVGGGVLHERLDINSGW